MDIKKITRLHADLLQGIAVDELSDKALLMYGTMLAKQYRQAKAILRKIEPESIAQTQHWVLIREHCSINVDIVLTELNSRMITDPEVYSDTLLLKFADLVAGLRVLLFDEQQLDNAEVENTEDVELIFNND